MAAPNVVNVTTITGKTGVLAVTTSAQNIVTNSANSNSVIKVNSLLISNIHGSSSTDLYVDLYRNSTSYYIAYTISVPADASLVVLSKDSGIYLEEGDSLRVWAASSSILHAVCSYEIIS